MQRLLLLCVMVLVTGCHLVDPDVPYPAKTYGKAGADTIAITTKIGFKKPGVYYVRRGTTFGGFLKGTKLLPRKGWWHPQYTMCDYRLQQLRQGRRAGILSHGKPSSEQLNTPLEDGAIVNIYQWNL